RGETRLNQHHQSTAMDSALHTAGVPSTPVLKPPVGELPECREHQRQRMARKPRLANRTCFRYRGYVRLLMGMTKARNVHAGPFVSVGWPLPCRGTVCPRHYPRRVIRTA